MKNFKKTNALVTNSEIINGIKTKAIVKHITQRDSKFTPGWIIRTLRSIDDNINGLENNFEEATTIIEMKKINDKWCGDSPVILSQVVGNSTLYLVDGGHRALTVIEFCDGKAVRFNASKNKKDIAFMKKLAKKLKRDYEKDSFTFEDLSKKVQKELLNIEFIAIYTNEHKEADLGTEFVGFNTRNAMKTNDLLNADMAVESKYYTLLKETVKSITSLNPNKGFDSIKLPAWYDKAPKKVKSNFKFVALALKGARKTPDALFNIMLRCTDNATWKSDRADAVRYEILERHKDLTESGAKKLLYNTINNMSIPARIFEPSLAAFPNAWTGAVHTFGSYTQGSYNEKNKENKKFQLDLINPSEQYLLSEDGIKTDFVLKFNDIFRDLYNGRRNTIGNLVINNGVDDKAGIVLNDSRMKTSCQNYNYVCDISKIFRAIYKEAKEEM